MRFRLRDLLLANIVVAICLTACVFTTQGSSIPPQYVGNHIIIFFGTTTFSMFVTSVWMRRRTIGRVSPIATELSADVSWKFAFCFAIVILLISFSDFRHVQLVVCAGASSHLSVTFFNMIHSNVLVCEQGLVYQQGLIPWDKVVVSRDPDGFLRQLQLRKIGRWSPITVPMEQQAIIENLLSKNQEPATNKLS